MTSTTLQELIATTRKDLNDLRRSSDVYESGAMEELMYDAYRLAIQLSASPEARADVTLRQLLAEASSVIEERNVDLSYYPWTVVRQFRTSWEANEWEQLCIARSGIEFFMELFRESVLAERVAGIDTSEIDEFIRESGGEGHLPDEAIPPEIPLSHWWWWYPDKPRPRPVSPA
ncbi:MAG TPA: hypothetical protein VK539_05280 [Myxococcaceae bacterium]|nr:hypothetical protein [Myxococcaceae bacterium]